MHAQYIYHRTCSDDVASKVVHLYGCGTCLATPFTYVAVQGHQPGSYPQLPYHNSYWSFVLKVEMQSIFKLILWCLLQTLFSA